VGEDDIVRNVSGDDVSSRVLVFSNLIVWISSLGKAGLRVDRVSHGTSGLMEVLVGHCGFH